MARCALHTCVFASTPTTDLVINAGTLVDHVTTHIINPLIQHAMYGPLPDAPQPTLADVVCGKASMSVLMQQRTTLLVAGIGLALTGAVCVVLLRRR